MINSNNVKRINVSAFFLLFFSVFVFSCKKDKSDAGIGMQPTTDLLNASIIDTFSVQTYSKTVDSLKTDELSFGLLGSYVDPVFGKVTSGIYTQLGLSTVGTIIDVSAIVDSVKLYIRYGSKYGDSDPQTFSVQRITQKFYKDSAYYSTRNLPTDGVELMLTGYETQSPDLVSNVVVGPDTLNPMLVLRLNNSIGTDILNLYGGGGLANESALNDNFFGFKIAVNNPTQATKEGAVLYMNMTDAQTKMVIYYTEISGTKALSFPIGTNQARFCNFSHNYSGTNVEAVVNDSTLGQKYFYAQTMAGIEGVVKIPGISDLSALGNIIINKAELYVPVEYFTTDPYLPSTNVILYYVDAEGQDNITIDQITTADFGGIFDNTKKAYVFNIARHLQKVVRGQLPNNGFKIKTTSASVSANRIVMNGSKSDNREHPYFKIYYTKY